jgi:hypothetical protein
LTACKLPKAVAWWRRVDSNHEPTDYEFCSRSRGNLRLILLKTNSNFKSVPPTLPQIRSSLASLVRKTGGISRKVAMLARPFDRNLADSLTGSFDATADQCTNILAHVADHGYSGREPRELAVCIARSQADVISLLREGEFQQAWPSLKTRLRLKSLSTRVQATCACPRSAWRRGDLAREFLGSGCVVGYPSVSLASENVRFW